MMLKLAALTAIFYVFLGFVMEASLFITAYLTGGASISSTRGGWWLIFGVMWFLAFAAAWHFAPVLPASLKR